MAWVRFIRNWDWTPPSMRRISMAFPRGYSGSVTHDCAAAAIAAGAAEEIEPPTRDERGRPVSPHRRRHQ